MSETLKCFVNGCESKGSGVVCAPCFNAEKARADALAKENLALTHAAGALNDRIAGVVARADALAAEVEAVTKALMDERHFHLGTAMDRTAAEAARDAAEKERDDYRDANNSVAVCAGHIGDIVAGDGLKNGCFVCECDRLAAALREIAEHPHSTDEPKGDYGIGIQDGHRCAAAIAAAAIAGEDKQPPKP